MWRQESTENSVQRARSVPKRLLGSLVALSLGNRKFYGCGQHTKEDEREQVNRRQIPDLDAQAYKIENPRRL